MPQLHQRHRVFQMEIRGWSQDTAILFLYPFISSVIFCVPVNMKLALLAIHSNKAVGELHNDLSFSVRDVAYSEFTHRMLQGHQWWETPFLKYEISNSLSSTFTSMLIKKELSESLIVINCMCVCVCVWLARAPISLARTLFCQI